MFLSETWLSNKETMNFDIPGVKKSTNLTALYGEIGRVPFNVYRKIIMVKYWIKVLGQSDLSLLKRIYLILQADTDANSHYNGMNWAYQIKNILQQHGLEYIWNQQHIIEIPFEFIKQRILDIYNQKWYSDINNSSRLQSYSIFKHNFTLEKYLKISMENKYKYALSRFRTSSHDLLIETGRYENIPRDQRLCKSCDMKTIESEYHFLLVCPKFRDLKKKYFKSYYCHWPTIHKFESLLSSNSKKVICNLSKYIYFAQKIRIP